MNDYYTLIFLPSFLNQILDMYEFFFILGLSGMLENQIDIRAIFVIWK